MKIDNPLVTILSPAYNEEKNIARFLNSILNQTYNNLELIIVNDGSTDNTENIINKYKEKFLEKNIKLIHIYQENSGQAAAINNGLKKVNGKYLAWPDSDDELMPTAIEEKVNFLLKNKEYKIVFNQANIIDENTGKKIGQIKLKDIELEKRNLLDDFIKEENIYFTSGCYLLNFEAFKKANNGLDILVKSGGQNWQMLIPMAKYYKFGYIPKPLYNYFFSTSSHSNSTLNSEVKMIKRNYEYKELLEGVLKFNNVYNERYEKILEEKYSRRRLKIYFKFYNKEKFNEEYKFLKENYSIGLSERLRKIIISVKPLHYLIFKIRNLIKKH